MLVQIVVTCQVDPLDETQSLNEGPVKDSVREAIEESVKHGESRGFNHSLSDEVGIGITSVDVLANEYVLRQPTPQDLAEDL